MTLAASGLYVLTQMTDQNESRMLTDMQAVLQAGAGMVQYRDKRKIKSPGMAKVLKALCRMFNKPMIVNDDIELAQAVAADGVHLGKDDGDVAEARALLGARAIIGVSCYDDLTRAQQAQAEGADYVAFGCFYSSTTKPEAPPARLATLAEARRVLKLPIVAIGGVLPENGASLLTAGADWLAVSGGVFRGDVYQNTQAYLKLFEAL